MGTHTHTNISSISLLQSNLKTNQQSKQIRSSTTIMSASTVNVKNISSATSEKEIKDFFSFCGKISSIEVTKSGESQNATVTFEKETAAKTALLLDNTQLGATQVQVSSATGSNDDDGSHFTQNTERDSDEITQEEKPRARIAAEYIAHGYVLGDQAIQKAIDLSRRGRELLRAQKLHHWSLRRLHMLDWSALCRLPLLSYDAMRFDSMQCVLVMHT